MLGTIFLKMIFSFTKKRMENNFTVREAQKNDIPHIVNYWKSASKEDLLAMGIDINNTAPLDDLGERLEKQLPLPYSLKGAFVLVAFVDEKPVGHCYVNHLVFGKEAFMHLHIWKSNLQQKGLGTQMVKKSIPVFFEKLELQTLFCEPAAKNPAPNKTLEKVGFKFIKKHTTVPAGWTFQLEVNRWEMILEDYQFLF